MKTSHRNFVNCLLADPQYNMSRAYKTVFNCSDSTAYAEGAMLAQRPDVAAALAEGKAARLKRLELTADDVLRDIALGVSSDGNELTEYALDSCRYCHGANHEYQFTPAEYKKALQAYIAADQERKGGPRDPMGLMFDTQGGIGFDPRNAPHPDCPECHGRGVGRIIPKDSRFLSEAGKRQYSGVKMGKHGVEILTRSRDKALEIAAKHTGVARENIKLETLRDLTDEQLAIKTAQAEHALKKGQP